MHTALGLFIAFIGCLCIALGCWGARAIYRGRPTVRKTPPPSMPAVYGGTMMPELRRESRRTKLFEFTLN